MKITLHFTNLDNFMGTREEASVTMDITADDDSHLYMLCSHLKNIMQADYYTLEEE